MADKTTTTKKLNAVANFADGDTRTISIQNPKPQEQLPALLATFQTLLAENNAILGDKNKGNFSHLSDAKIVTTTETDFDLG